MKGPQENENREAETVGKREHGMSVVVKRNASVGVWEGVKGNELCQTDLFFNCQSIPGAFSLDARIREVVSFNNRLIHYKYKHFFFQMYF